MIARRVVFVVGTALALLFASGAAAQSVVQAGAPAQVPAGNCSQGQLDYVAMGFGASVVTGGATNLTSVTVSNAGTALPADWVRIRLVREVTINTTVDGTDVIVGTVNSTAFPITFSGLSNQIPAAPGAAVYLLAIDVAGAGTSTVGRTFTLNVTAMTATAAIVNGLPLAGNAQTIVAPSLCEIDVQRILAPPTSIATGGNDLLGNRATGVAFNLTYTILNTGSAALNLTGAPAINIPSLSITNCTASVTATPTTPVAAAGSTTFTIQCTPSAGAFGFGIRIDNNDSNENPYNILVSGTGVTPAPEMDVTRGVTTINNSGSDALGSVPSGAAQNVTYTITNSGTATLNLTGATLVVVAPVTNITTVSVTAQPTNTVTAAGTTTFTVSYTVTATGAFTFSISIANNDASENPYNWNVTGTGAGAVPELDVSRAATPIASGGTDTVGTFTAGITSPISYTLANTGSATLNISAAGATPGANCMVTVATAAPATITAGNSAPLVIDVTPVAAGAFDFTITITNDDPNESTYTFTVSGVATAGTGGGGGGGGGSGGGGCSTEEGSAWGGMVAALCALALALRLRRKHA